MRNKKLSLLGSVECELDGKALHLGSQQAIVLLAFLAEKKRAVGRSELLELFWEDDSERSKNNLRVMLSRINKRFPQSLQVERSSVRFCDEHIDLDTRNFQELAQKDDPQDWQRACELYRGSFMLGLQPQVSSELENWLGETRLHWQERVCYVYERIARQVLEGSDVPTDHALSLAVDRVQAWLELDPLNEDACLALLQLHAKRREYQAAKHCYQHFQTVFQQELRLSPRDDLVKAYHRIEQESQRVHTQAQSSGSALRRQETIPDAGVFHYHSEPKPKAISYGLPRQLGPLIGREQELALIQAHLRDPYCQLLTLFAAGGTGKTRLAAGVAENMVGEEICADGTIWLSLEYLQDDAQLINALAQALSMEQHEQQGLEQVCHALRDKNLLLILDNFEHLLATKGLLVGLLRHCPKLTCLVTSREKLQLEQEWLLPLQGLYSEIQPPLEPSLGQDTQLLLSELPAVQFFLYALRRHRLGYQVSAQDLNDILRICQLVDGSPLAIELAASLSDMMTCADIAREITKGVDFLMRTSSHDANRRHFSLRAVFDHSWNLCGPVEQEALTKVAIFRGGFSGEAAKWVSGVALNGLRALVDKSFLRYSSQQGSQRRYERHPLLYEFMLEKLHEQGPLYQELCQKHCDYFVNFCEHAETRLQEQASYHHEVQLEYNNIQAAFDWAIAHHLPEPALGIASASGTFWNFTSRYSEARKWLLAALALNSPRQSVRFRYYRAKAQRWLAVFAYMQSEYRLAQQYLEECSPEYLELFDLPQIASIYKILGVVHVFQGHYQEGEGFFNKALDIVKRFDGQERVADITGALGFLAWARGDIAEAKQYFRSCLLMFQGQESEHDIASALTDLGLCEELLGNLEAARSLLEKALASHQQAQNPHAIARTLNNLAAVDLKEGYCDRAAERYLQSLQLKQQLGQKLSSAWSLEGLARVAWRLGHHQASTLFYAQASNIRQRIGTPLEQAYVEEFGRQLEHLQAQANYHRLWQQGEMMSLKEALEYGKEFWASQPHEGILP